MDDNDDNQVVDQFFFQEWDNSLAKRDRTLHLCLISAKGQRLHQGVAPLPQSYYALYFNIVQEKLFASMLYNRQDRQNRIAATIQLTIFCLASYQDVFGVPGQIVCCTGGGCGHEVGY